MAMWHFRLFFLLLSLPRGNAVHLHLQRAAWAVPLRCILHRSTLHRPSQRAAQGHAAHCALTRLQAAASTAPAFTGIPTPHIHVHLTAQETHLPL